jgi:membrane-associated phospholipid phosphatase
VLFSWLFFLISLSSSALATEGQYTFEKIKPLRVLTAIPSTSIETVKTAFSKEAIWPWVGIVTSTAILYHYDEEILRDLQYQGRQWGLGNSDNTKTFVKAGNIDVLRLPTDAGSALYFLGDGWIHMGTAVGFSLVGQWSANTRAWNTGLEMIHGMITSTIFSQAFKRATGRESPDRKSENRGAWRPFPSIAAYGKSTATYDAFPSGHVMTATLVFTVFHQNYPEYANWTIPIGALWVSALSYQMVNNGVHWASDYPLGIAMGYLIGKLSVRLAGGEGQNGSAQKTSNWMIYPSLDADTPSLNLVMHF